MFSDFVLPKQKVGFLGLLLGSDHLVQPPGVEAVHLAPEVYKVPFSHAWWWGGEFIQVSLVVRKEIK